MGVFQFHVSKISILCVSDLLYFRLTSQHKFPCNSLLSEPQSNYFFATLTKGRLVYQFHRPNPNKVSPNVSVLSPHKPCIDIFPLFSRQTQCAWRVSHSPQFRQFTNSEIWEKLFSFHVHLSTKRVIPTPSPPTQTPKTTIWRKRYR